MNVATLRVLILALAGLALAACASNSGIERLREEVRSRLPWSSASPPAATAEPAPEASVQAAIQLVIYRGNFEQEQAIARREPTVGSDTATDGYYRELARTNRDLIRSGVTAIKLVELEWGPITVRGDTATATTYETWTVTLADDTTQQSRDRNLYRLVQQNGRWKIQSNEHPDAPPSLPPGGREV